MGNASQSYPTIDSDEFGRVRADVLERIRNTICRYKCGECEYDKTDTWGAHQAHHHTHEEQS